MLQGIEGGLLFYLLKRKNVILQRHTNAFELWHTNLFWRTEKWSCTSRRRVFVCQENRKSNGTNTWGYKNTLNLLPGGLRKNMKLTSWRKFESSIWNSISPINWKWDTKRPIDTCGHGRKDGCRVANLLWSEGICRPRTWKCHNQRAVFGWSVCADGGRVHRYWEYPL